MATGHDIINHNSILSGKDTFKSATFKPTVRWVLFGNRQVSKYIYSVAIDALDIVGIGSTILASLAPILLVILPFEFIALSLLQALLALLFFKELEFAVTDPELLPPLIPFKIVPTYTLKLIIGDIFGR